MENAQIVLTDANGSSIVALTNAAGNFYLVRAQWDPTYPITVKIAVGDIGEGMHSEILKEHCTKSCHAAGGTASDRLLTDYDHVFVLRGAVLDQVFACRIPPSPTALPEDQRAVILAWLVCHAPDN